MINHEKQWMGGLISLAIVVLIIVTCRFSISFWRLYPIENISTTDRASVSCDSNLINAKFTSSLQLLSIIKHEKEKPIFLMLDEQPITLSVEFVSTGFSCANVTMQQNMDRGQQKPMMNLNCSFDDENFLLSISTLLPQPWITLQFNLTGPYFVGGLRICLSAPKTVKTNSDYTVQQLNFCHLLFAPNQTLTIDPTVSLEMMKVVNRTEQMSLNDDPSFSGLWLPTLTTKNRLWDAHLYTDGDEYRRYLNMKIILVIEMIESKFYLKNTQEPIAREYEISFKTVLFSMTCLELFGLLALFFKMIVTPLVRRVQQRYLKQQNVHVTTITK